jgi:excisionase family DNA binding protein
VIPLERNAFSRKEFCDRNGIGHSKFYEEVKAGRLRAHKLGRKVLIFADDEQAWRDGIPELATDNMSRPPARRKRGAV